MCEVLNQTLLLSNNRDQNLKKIIMLRSASAVITMSILATSVVTVAKGRAMSYEYTPSAEVSSTFGNARNLFELNYMQPISGNRHHLHIFDLKLKTDNKKSKEINLGLVYRHNVNDNAIWGIYGYFDHRETGNKFSVNAFTAGAEILSKYLDVRTNIYIPQDKRKKILHNNKQSILIESDSVYALSGGHKYEYPLQGHDFEIGFPIFGLSNKLNNMLGTRFSVARYNFYSGNTRSAKGVRFRLDQPIGRLWVGSNALDFNLSAQSQKDGMRGRQNSVSLKAKVSFDAKKYQNKIKQSPMRYRMMDTVIRDADIVTPEVNDPPMSLSLFNEKRELIRNVHDLINAKEVSSAGKEVKFKIKKDKDTGAVNLGSGDSNVQMSVVVNDVEESLDSQALQDYLKNQLAQAQAQANVGQVPIAPRHAAMNVPVPQGGQAAPQNNQAVQAVNNQLAPQVVQQQLAPALPVGHQNPYHLYQAQAQAQALLQRNAQMGSNLAQQLQAQRQIMQRQPQAQNNQAVQPVNNPAPARQQNALNQAIRNRFILLNGPQNSDSDGDASDGDAW